MELNFDIIFRNLPFLLKATLVTIKITLLSFIVAITLAFIVGILRTYKFSKILDLILNAYVEIFRGSPLLIQLFFIYYGLPSVGIAMDAEVAAVIGLALNGAAYMSEIIRAAIISIDRGQEEAGFSLGYTRLQNLCYIILPQAAQISVPPLVNGFSSLLKDTSLISVISITELTRSGNLIYSRTARPFEVYLTLGLFYFVLTYIVSICSKFIEKRNEKWN
ncbi:amino acid ABC transporter permease [Clostridium botulinum]|uniref:Amino acid ABC transporter, permease protein, His/Glu/Gln/Arg/opine family n=2 Tax=Clostridium botulinum TaxID=1491 RepID=A7GDB5_CLOBL|nr:amino acid ABC transporter permease [Clostridium botulinum]EKX79797.1 amino acid ABC transporter permease [Clostridium botulinum CFSAN001628]ABS40608.1 amino acid ABC transporter, permease protein, His/Glu/Gln/Arg/opine family [Clostridium botulinum F str. Langeland]ACA45048.1 amino acid ABC transporter, permease protein, His/Glu/Gln/Arg/opine family [Clostridium botulinum B1 str. Okra]ADF99224.1 amino acid ABC transporter, permease protein, His/Glu/Gln/Arg/opine family [Clostridium botulinu